MPGSCTDSCVQGAVQDATLLDAHRTGDLGRISREEGLHVSGRQDLQVKVKGISPYYAWYRCCLDACHVQTLMYLQITFFVGANQTMLPNVHVIVGVKCTTCM